MSINVQLPNGETITVAGVDDPQQAAASARLYFQRSNPDAYAEWAKTLPRNSFGSTLSRGVDEEQGRLYGFLEAAGGATGIERLQRFGQRGRERNLLEAEAAAPAAGQQSFLDSAGVGDVLSAGKQAIAGSLPSSAAPLASGAAGALLGSAIAPGPGTVIGGLLGAAAGAFPSLAGGNVQRQVETTGQMTSPGAALATAVPQALASGVVDAVTLRLAGILGRPAAEVGHALWPRIARGIGVGAATELPEEVFQTVLERAQAGLPLTDPDALREYGEAAAGAVVAGGAMGGAAKGIGGKRPEAPAATPPPPEAPPAPAREPLLPETPAPFTEATEAQDWLRQNPGMRPPGIPMGVPLSDAEALAVANTQRQLTHREEVGHLRRHALSELLGVKNIDVVTDEAGKETRIRNGQAETVVPTILRAATENRLSLDAFTADDLSNLYMEELGPSAEPPTAAEIKTIRTELNALLRDGFLSPGLERDSFTISSRNYEALRQARDQRAEENRLTQPGARSLRAQDSEKGAAFPGLADLAMQAPPTAEQQSLGALLPALSQLSTNPSQEIASQIASIADAETTTPEVRRLISDYSSSVAAAAQASASLKQLPLSADALPDSRRAEVLAERENLDATLTSEAQTQAGIVEYLQGLYEGKFRGQALPDQPYIRGESRTVAPAPATPTTQVGLGAPDYASVTPEVKAATDEALAERLRARAATEQATSLSEFQALLNADPIATRTLLTDLTAEIGPRGGLSYQRILKAAQNQGIELSSAEATSLYKWAASDGFINGAGNITGRPVDQQTGAPSIRPTTSEIPIGGPTQAPLPSSRQPLSPMREQAPATGPTLTDRLADISKRQQQLVNAATNGAKLFAGKAAGARVKVAPGVNMTNAEFQAAMGAATQKLGEDFANLQREIAAEESRTETGPAQEESTTGQAAFTEGEGREDNIEPQFSANPGAASRLEPFTETERAEAEAIFRRVAGPNARIEFRPRLTLSTVSDVVAEAMRTRNIETADGVTLGDLAILSMQGSANRSLVDTGIHEGYHVAENLGIINTNAQQILDGEAPTLRRRLKEARTSGGEALLTPAQVDALSPSELRAYGANAYALYGARFNGAVDRIFRNLTNFYNRIRNALRGFGYTTSDDVYRDFLSGRSAEENAGRTIEATRDLPPQFMASQRPTTPKQAVEQYERQLSGPLGRYLEWLGSPTMFGKFKPALRGASDIMRRMYYATQEFTQGVQQYLTPIVSLSNADRAALTSVFANANAANGKFDDSRLSPEAKQAATSMQTGLKNAFNYYVDAWFTDSFVANENTKPTEKRRLDALWSRHAGKRLSDIPRTELRAANPAAFKDLADFERMYNPNYMPMLMHGSHFMAAYARKPDGTRDTKPVGIVFFNPSSMTQRMRGQNETAYFRGQLAQKFGDTNKYIITEPREATRDAEARTYVEQMDAIEKFINAHRQMTKGADESIRQTAKDLATQFDKRQLSRIFRKSDGVLMAVHDRNKETYLLDTLPAYVMGAARIYARRATQDAYNREANKLHFEDRAYFDKLRDYASTPTDRLYGLRSLQFFWQLGAAPDSAIVNLLQTLMQTVPRMMRDGASLNELYKAYGPALKLLPGLFRNQSKSSHETFARLQKTLTDPAERAAIARAEAGGVFEPIFSGESRGQISFEKARQVFGDKSGAGIAKKMNAALNLISSPMQVAEQTNRFVTFLAAHRAAVKNPDIIRRANKQDGGDLKTAYDYATDVVDTTQYIASKEDKALVQRLNGVTEIATQFMSFSIKTIEQALYHSTQLLSLDKSIDGPMRKAAAYSIITQMGLLTALGGLFALPMLGLLRDAAEGLIKDEFGGPINFETELRRLLGDNGFAAKAVVRGIPYALGLADISGRLAVSPVRSQMFTDPTIFNWLGPTGSTAGNIIKNVGPYIQNDDWVGFSTLFMPRALGNVVRAGSLAAGYDMYTRRNSVIAKAEDLDTGDIMQMAMGFPPPRIADARAIVHQVDQLDAAMLSQTQSLNKDAAGHLKDYMTYRQRGEMAKAQEEIVAFQQRIQKAAEHNRRVLDSGDQPDLSRLININLRAIQRQAQEEFYGIASPQMLMRNARPTSRPEVQRLMSLYGISQ